MAGDRRHYLNGFADIDYGDNFEDFGEPHDMAFRRRPPFVPGPGGRQSIIIVHSRVGQLRRRYSVDQEVLFNLLPRVRGATRRGALELSTFFREPYLENHPEDLMNWALDFVFQHLSEFTRLEAMDMFSVAVQDIENDPVRGRAVNEWAAQMHALCIVLSNGRGLGCSEDLFGRILDFFEFLIQEVHNILGWNQVAVLFEAFANIARTRRGDQVQQIRRIWNRFDPEVQQQILSDIRRALPVEGMDEMAHRMYRILGY
ncbi:uncharacterized protein FTJAE_7876 [Fusarium tjaetaba]|uniref:Uncharacterized protein n=1 Tax=Fusarium tjaetaba TaxID=1567544 RepID=A0A8H5RE35_9HYPO|nr:uncharacterized protein FTJAE_7876 [Fusarium tjaetaba]KAF5631544.1 hypothetical protein FTJAE_7876 [Fusarium tjaetaba]